MEDHTPRVARCGPRLISAIPRLQLASVTEKRAGAEGGYDEGTEESGPLDGSVDDSDKAVYDDGN